MPSSEQLALIGMAQALSFHTCEQCGRPGQILVHEFFHLTRCVEHAPIGAVPREEFLASRDAAKGA